MAGFKRLGKSHIGIVPQLQAVAACATDIYGQVS